MVFKKITTSSAIKNRGLTLIELILAIFLLSLISILISNIYITQSKNLYTQQSKIEAQIAAKNTVDIIQVDIKEAVNVESSAIPQNTSLEPGESVLLLKTPSLDEDGSILYDISGQIVYFDYIIYEVTTTNEIMKYTYPDINSSRIEENRVVGVDIESASFDYLPSGPTPSTTTSVSISLVITKNNNPSTFETQIIKLRNK